MPSWIGWPEIVVLAIIALVIFGPKRLPELGHSIGKAITSFRKGIKETEQEVKKGLADNGGDTAKAEAVKTGTAAGAEAKSEASGTKENQA
jgi:sec-independent protein translocase protein TatA